MNIGELAKRIGRQAAANSPALLTGAAILGVVATAALAHKAGAKVAEAISAEEHEHFEVMPPRVRWEFIKSEGLWKHYIPPVAMGLVTVGAIVSAHKIGAHRAAAVTVAYAASTKAWDEMQEKLEEKLGPKKAQEVREEVAQNRINQIPSSEYQVVVLADGDSLCLDTYSKRPFRNTWEGLRKAMNDVNVQIATSDDFVTLSEFYEMIGLPPAQYSDEVGWDREHPLHLRQDVGVTEDNKPCLVIDYKVIPVRDPHRSYFR